MGNGWFWKTLWVLVVILGVVPGGRIHSQETFYRGDCNSSQLPGGMAVDIGDPASLINYLFGTGTRRFSPRCLDACDANDDGHVNIADVIFLLNYLFRMGPFPPPPGPGFSVERGTFAAQPPGTDPTLDGLGCAFGVSSGG